MRNDLHGRLLRRLSLLLSDLLAGVASMYFAFLAGVASTFAILAGVVNMFRIFGRGCHHVSSHFWQGLPGQIVVALSSGEHSQKHVQKHSVSATFVLMSGCARESQGCARGCQGAYSDCVTGSHIVA